MRSQAAATCYINLVLKESDNNAKLIVLDRFDTLRAKHGHVLDPLITDILQILSRYSCSAFKPLIIPNGICSTDLEVRRKAMSIVLSLTTSRNVEDVVLFLKKQLQRTQDQEFEKVFVETSPSRRCLTLCDGARALTGTGIQTTSHPVYSCLRCQIFGSGRECRACTHGFPRRFKQPICT